MVSNWRLLSVASTFVGWFGLHDTESLATTFPQHPYNPWKMNQVVFFGEGNNVEALLQSLFTLVVAELFDRTWFVAFMMALNGNRWVVFAGSLIGLLLHVVIAAGLGVSISQMISLCTLNFIAAGTFFIMACYFTREWWTCEPGSDIMAVGKEEAAEDIKTGWSEPLGIKESSPLLSSGSKPVNRSSKWSTFMRTFWLIFVAEWGDCTQIAMISLLSAKPVIPVCVGSTIALFFVTASAVMAAAFVGETTLSERTVKGVIAASFFICTFCVFQDGMSALEDEVNMRKVGTTA